ncbi:hypothetical protein [Achromobacter dolens]|uniref:hypothetical protein n=1 Tax=Achromobacter dolens TaxID=1287738 RepID=UPI0035565908
MAPKNAAFEAAFFLRGSSPGAAPVSEYRCCAARRFRIRDRPLGSDRAVSRRSTDLAAMAIVVCGAIPQPLLIGHFLADE